MSADGPIVCLDLEGPLTAEDYGFRLFAETVADGDRIYAIISRYDDALTERGRAGYEAGDTLALIVPFLAANGLRFDDISAKVGRYASTITGAQDLVAGCQRGGRTVYVISASYEPFAFAVADRVGLSRTRVCSTRLSAQAWRSLSLPIACEKTLAVQTAMRDRFSDGDLMTGAFDGGIVDLLDSYFHSQLPKVGCPYPGSIVRPLGGRRKARAVETVARRCDVSLSSIVYVGDSITDVAALRCVDSIGGLAVAFNGNRYALAAAAVAVASHSVIDVLPLVEAWSTGGTEAVRELAHTPLAEGCADLVWLPDLTEAQREATIARHARTRRAVRDAAGSLG